MLESLPTGKVLGDDAAATAGAQPGEGEYHTRWIYFAKFAWGACFGRFMSLYYLAEGLDEAEIGAVFAIGTALGPLISTGVGILADRLAVRVASARHLYFAGCVLLGTVTFTLQAIRIPGVSRFSVMLGCRVLLAGCSSSGDVLVDAITVRCLRDRRRFGKERLYGAVSWAIMHMLLGMLIDRFGMVVLHVGIILNAAMTFVILLRVGVPPLTTEESGSPSKGARGLAALADKAALRALLASYCSSGLILAFFVYSFTLGIGMTLVENLIFLLFRELNASYVLCGLSVVVTVVFEIPLFAVSDRLLARVGAPGLLAAAGLCYSFRVVGYTLSPGGWYILLFEPMHGVTIATSSTASVEMVASITPPALAATGQALFGLVRSSLGSTTGNLVGGAVIRHFGESACYRSSALIVMAGLAVYKAALLRQDRRPGRADLEELPSKGAAGDEEVDERLEGS